METLPVGALGRLDSLDEFGDDFGDTSDPPQKKLKSEPRAPTTADESPVLPPLATPPDSPESSQSTIPYAQRTPDESDCGVLGEGGPVDDADDADDENTAGTELAARIHGARKPPVFYISGDLLVINPVGFYSSPTKAFDALRNEDIGSSDFILERTLEDVLNSEISIRCRRRIQKESLGVFQYRREDYPSEQELELLDKPGQLRAEKFEVATRL